MAVDHRNAPPKTFHPRWPTRDAMDFERATFNYWHEIDTLMVDFTGSNPPAAGFPLDLDLDRDYLYLRVDVETEAVVGLQIEDFLSVAIHRHPYLLDMLDLATLHGITPAEIEHLRRSVDPVTRKRAALAAVLNELIPLSA